MCIPRMILSNSKRLLPVSDQPLIPTGQEGSISAAVLAALMGLSAA